jgi:hypothetical protein
MDCWGLPQRGISGISARIGHETTRPPKLTLVHISRKVPLTRVRPGRCAPVGLHAWGTNRHSPFHEQRAREGLCLRCLKEVLWAPPPTAKDWKSGQKLIAMGADNRQNVQKQRDFQAEMVFSQNGGLAPAVEKCEFPRENSTRYGFDPLKRCGFLLKRSQTMRIPAENTRVRAENNHKPTKVSQRLS